MVGAIVLSPTDAASQEAVVGWAERVVVARARAPRDLVPQHYRLEYFGCYHPDFDLEGGARSVVQFEGVLPKAAPCVAYAPVDLVVGVPPEVYELVRLVVHLVGCFYAEYDGGGLVRKHMVSVLASDTVRPNAAHTTTIIASIIFLSCSGDCETTPASSVKHAPKRRRQGWFSGGCSPPTSRPRFLPRVHQSVHDILVCLETRVGNVYNRLEEYVEQEEREYAPLTKTLLHSGSPRAHPVVEPHACSHGIDE